MSDTFRIVTTSGTTVASVTPIISGVSVFDFASQEATDEQPLEGEREWEGILGVIGHATSDRRYLIPDEIDTRDFPLPFNVQTKTAEGHDGADNAGRIEEILYVPAGEFDREEWALPNVPDEAVVIWGRGVLDDSPAADEAERLIGNGAGVSLDLPPDRWALIDPETFAEVAEEDADLDDVLSGKYLTGVAGKIAGATIVTIPAFEEAAVKLTEESVLVASAYGMRVISHRMVDLVRPLVAAAAPLKPPRAWFEDPGLQKLTPLTIEKSGRVYGHLADWSGCHTGFGSVCVPPFRSPSNFAYFNVDELECDDGSMVTCGKWMFSRDGQGHADTDPRLSVAQVSKHYDDSTKVAAFVKAGSDRHGTYLVGCLRHDLSEIEVQHLRSHSPSGDWRPIPGKGTELVAAFSVPVGGFPIPRALVASAQDGSLVIITAPLDLEFGPRQAIRQRQMLRSRLRAALSR